MGPIGIDNGTSHIAGENSSYRPAFGTYPVSFESTPYASVNQAKEQTRVVLTVGLVSVVRPVECSESRLQRQ